MKKNNFSLMLLISLTMFSFVILLSCSKSKPNESQLATDLTDALNWRQAGRSNYLNEFVALVDCEKQNGMSPSQNEYVMEFTGHVSAVKPFYSVRGTWPLHPTLKRFYKNRAVRIEAGQLLKIKGKAHYVLTEKGWRVTSIDAPMVTPNNKLKIFSVSGQ